MKRILPILAACGLAIGATASAAADCFEAAAHRYQISTTLLRAIAIHESNDRLNAVSPPNRHGRRDYCAMQINDQHFPLLSKYGITPELLLSDRCTCIKTGAWLLAGEISAVGNTWEAVARYNVGRRGSLDIGREYAAKVQAIYDRLASSPASSVPASSAAAPTAPEAPERTAQRTPVFYTGKAGS